jgi:hypothetical protein
MKPQRTGRCPGLDRPLGTTDRCIYYEAYPAVLPQAGQGKGSRRPPGDGEADSRARRSRATASSRRRETVDGKRHAFTGAATKAQDDRNVAAAYDPPWIGNTLALRVGGHRPPLQTARRKLRGIEPKGIKKIRLKARAADRRSKSCRAARLHRVRSQYSV